MLNSNLKLHRKVGLFCLFPCYHPCRKWSRLLRRYTYLPPSAEPEKFYQTGNQTEKSDPGRPISGWGLFSTSCMAGREIDETCISPSAYLALERCCSWLLFRRYVEGSVLKLHKAEFCRHRLCPTCNWRKSLKLFSQMKEVSARLLQDFPGARYLFLTLTVKNCSGAELAQTIDKMNFGFKLLVNAGKTNASAKAVKANLLGYAKAMEIKYDAEKTITPEMYAQRKNTT